MESVSAPKALGHSPDRAARRSHGAWYTPPALVNFLVELAERLLHQTDTGRVDLKDLSRRARRLPAHR